MILIKSIIEKLNRHHKAKKAKNFLKYSNRDTYKKSYFSKLKKKMYELYVNYIPMDGNWTMLEDFNEDTTTNFYNKFYNTGIRQDIINDNIFSKSLYIKTLEEELGIKNFKKEYREQYEIMLDTFRTLILVNNAFYSDTNGGLEDRIELATNILAKYLYKDDSETTKKYGSRKINNLFDEYCISLNKKLFKWYEVLQTPANYLKTHPKELDIIKEEISNEIKILKFINYDYTIENNIILKKDSNTKYSKYLSKFNYLNPQREQFIKEYKKDFYDTYKQMLSNEDIKNITYVYDLIVSLNNGIVDLINYNKPNEVNGFMITQDDNIFYYYLKRELKIKPLINSTLYKEECNLFYTNLKKIVKFYELEKIKSNDDIQPFYDKRTKIYYLAVNYYNFFLFKYNMDLLLKSNITIKNKRIAKIMNDYILELKNIYNELLIIYNDFFEIFQDKKISEENINILKNTLKRCKKIIEKEFKIFIRIR